MATPTPAPPDVRGLDPAWINTINLSVGDPRWDELDPIIFHAVSTFNQFLRGNAGFSGINPALIKAMCWTETGAVKYLGNKLVPNHDWATFPMQIGSNPQDPGAHDLLVARKQRTDLFLPPEYRDAAATRLTMGNIGAGPAFNIPAGIALLLLNACHFKYVSVPSGPAKPQPYLLKRGDTFGKIARTQHTTLSELVADNADIAEQVGAPAHPGDAITVRMKKSLQPNQQIQVRTAAMQWSIAYWDKVDEHLAAEKYNTLQGDPRYYQKLLYCEWIMQGGKP